MHEECAMTGPLAALMVVKRFYEHVFFPLEKETGLTRIELDILVFLMENPNFNTATAIIDNNHFSKSHVSGALKHMEARGLIRKFFDEKNRKTTYLSLTDDAFDIAQKARDIKESATQSLMNGIEPNDILQMLSTLNKIMENAHAVAKENPLD